MNLMAKLRLLIALVLVAEGFGAYPETSLQCFSSLTQPRFKLICPEARNKYCVKQVSTLTQNLCGATQYFGDTYTNKECQFKKCSDTCTPGTTTFEFEGKQYSRTTYCCKTDFCNAGSSNMPTYGVMMISILLATFLLFFT